MPRDVEVLVVGGGPAGAATAYWLARAGVGVTLVDRARFPRPKPCAEYLSPRTARLLDEMGALTAVERAGAVRLRGMTIRAPDGTIFGRQFTATPRPLSSPDRDHGLALPRSDLDAIVLGIARDAGAHVEEGWRVLDLERDARGRVVGIVGADGSGAAVTRRARVVIGADGLRSIVARRLTLARRARFPERYACVAHFRDVTGIGDQVEMHVTAHGYVGLADIGQGRTSVALVVPAALMAAARGGAAPFLSQWLASHPHLAPRFATAERLTDVSATGPFASRARRACAPGAALVGDAAEFFDPITGQGVASALRGGALLAPFAAEAARAHDTRTADGALAAYARAHRREFRGQRVVERLIALAVAHPSLFDRAAHALARRRGAANLFLGVTAGLVPSHEVLRARFLFDLLRAVAR